MKGSVLRWGVPVLALAAVVGGIAAPADAQSSASEPVRRVLVLSVPGVSYRDLDLHRLPNLAGLLQASAIADLSARGVNRQPTLGDAYVTVGAGTRAVGRAVDDGQCLAADAPFEDGTAAEATARRTGTDIDAVSAGTIVCLAQPLIVARNDRLLYDAEPGLLGNELARAGVHAAAIGNADRSVVAGTTGYARPVGLAVADSDGIVRGGAVGSNLLTRDPAAPFGVRAEPDAYLDAFRREWRDRSVVVVEASDLVRFDAYRSLLSSDAKASLLGLLLEAFDALVGDMLVEVDAGRDAVMVVGPAPLNGTARLTMAALRAPGLQPGLLESAYTRHAGVVSIVDVGPTVLDLLGIERPSAMEGRPFERAGTGGGFEDRLNWVTTIDEAARFRDRMVAPVTTFFAVSIIVLVVAAALALVRFHRLRTPVEVVALMLLGFLPASYLARFFPFHDWGWFAYWAFLFAVGVGLGLAVWLSTTRNGITTLIVMLSIVVGVITVDILTGAHLQFNSTLGYSPTVAGRFAGIGNLGYAQLSAGSLLLAGFVAARVGGRRGAWIGIALLALAFLLDGLPFFGADVGGVLSMVPAYALTATMLLGWRIRWRLVAAVGLGTVVLLALFAAVDASRPEDDRTHLGRLVHTTTDGGWDAFLTVIQRKLDANFSVLFHSTWTVMFPIVLIGVCYLVYSAPGGVRALADHVLGIRAALAGLVVLAALGFALNDSGIAVPGMMLGVVAPTLVVLAERSDRLLAGDTLDEEMRDLQELVKT
jgi:hypothetical protein